jgi:hypothetical protein
MDQMKKISIIGGGPAALMLAAQLDTEKYQVTLYDKKKTVGRKFLVAGEGGLNLTYDAPLEDFTAHYFPSAFMAPFVRQFTSVDLMSWLGDLDIPTFIGSSKRVFPDPKLKPIAVLNKMVAHLSTRKIAFQTAAKWVGWNAEGQLSFEPSAIIKSDIVVFALGGASWKVTGSDGAWRKAFEARGVRVEAFRAANCAFGVDWDKKFISAHEGKPLKNVALAYNGHYARGELVISSFGLEGNAIYALSQKIQEALLTEKSVVVYLDLKPSMTLDQIRAKYRSSGRSDVTDILKKDLNLNRTFIALLKQFSDRKTFLNLELLAATIKSVPITIHAADALDKAISTLGGIALDEVDANLQLKKIPNAYAIGEMLDWYAPTGGYLLQGCFSMGFVLAKHLNALAAGRA